MEVILLATSIPAISYPLKKSHQWLETTTSATCPPSLPCSLNSFLHAKYFHKDPSRIESRKELIIIKKELFSTKN